jgi:hypothetical protein
MAQIPKSEGQRQPDSVESGVEPGHSPFGCMKGTLTIAPGLDLTQPAWPDWDAYAEKKYGPESELGKLWAQVVEREKQRRNK